MEGRGRGKERKKGCEGGKEVGRGKRKGGKEEEEKRGGGKIMRKGLVKIPAFFVGTHSMYNTRRCIVPTQQKSADKQV